ncbi:MAG: hypothetical protein CM15mP40_07900 [Alphaproteobacteria bacterium]|nr:MAG: hypothetical protein CM15mP40_07900 [Alphaproteobacteria bacterium]
MKNITWIRQDVFMIGDKLTDLEAAKNAQIKGFLFNKSNLKNFIEKILDKINF